MFVCPVSSVTVPLVSLMMMDIQSFIVTCGVAYAFSSHSGLLTSLPPWMLILIGLSIFAFLFYRTIENFHTPGNPKSPLTDEQDLNKASYLKYRQSFFPPPYPNGWYKLAFAEDIKAGQVAYVQALGTHFAIFRGMNNNKISVLDAFCPHLGANMAIGGTVKGDCLQCPFHLWEFNGEGKVHHIPYYDGKTPNARVKVWNSEERYGIIMVWFDVENREPLWKVPELYPSAIAEDIIYHGLHRGETVPMHIQDMPENGVDFAHFHVLHNKMHIPWTRYALPTSFMQVHHEASWEAPPAGATYDDEKPKHLSWFYDRAVVSVFGKKLEFTRGGGNIVFVGPSGFFFMNFFIPDVGNIYLIESHLPKGPMELKTDWIWYAEKKVPSAVVWYVVGQWKSQWHNDIDIWSNKVYTRPPVVLRTDGPVAKFRRWYAQFYSDNSQQWANDEEGRNSRLPEDIRQYMEEARKDGKCAGEHGELDCSSLHQGSGAVGSGASPVVGSLDW